MQCLIIFALLFLFSISTIVAAADECPAVTTSTTMRLKQKLLCNYDSELRPVKEHTVMTNVSYNMFVSAFVFHEDINVLEVRSWVNLRWQDEHLSWAKSEYAGIETLAIRCNRIWVPDVALTSSSPDVTMPDFTAGHCLLTSNGSVLLGLTINHMSECISDITRWPFDTQNCTMEIGSWAYFENEINLTYRGDQVKYNYLSREWNLLSASFERSVEAYENLNQTWPLIKHSFVIQRHPGGAVATVFIPAIVLATMTIVTFWMEPGHPERLKLIHVNVVCHCMYMIYMGIRLQGNGDNVPLIITFFRDSFLLTGISLLVALSSGRMISTARAPPTWITSITERVLATYPGQILLFGETESKNVAAALNADGKYEGLTLVEASVMRSWRLFAILIDRLCFLTFTVSLFILLTGFIPRSV